MRWSRALQATISHAANRPSRTHKSKATLSLEHFLVRQRVLSLWREVARALYKIPPSSTRTELRAYARGEFERNRNVQDVAQIRYLISTGKTEFETMERYVNEQAAS